MSYCRLTDGQLLCMFSILSSQPPDKYKLKRLVSTSEYIKDVPRKLFSTGTVRLKELGLASTYLGSNQLTDLLENILSQENYVESLDLSNACFSGIPSDIIGSALSKIHILNISDSIMEPNQVTAFMK